MALISSGSSMPKMLFLLSSSGLIRCSIFAIEVMLMPCTINDIRVITNTILKIWSENSMPATTGYVANIIGTAPLNPTHETKSLDLIFTFLKGSNVRNTLAGLPTIIIKMPISTAMGMTCIISSGFTRSPSDRNIISCTRVVIPSRNLVISFLYTIFLFPTIIPAIYTAR